MTTSLSIVENQILSVQNKFIKVLTEKLDFEKEKAFAMQLFNANSFLLKTAQNNPASLEEAMVNVAAIGLTLSPAENLAYLVPRDGKVCLDLGYRGIIKIGTDTGSILWANAQIVKENDEFCRNGIGEKPTHKINEFSDRGKVVGVYSVAKTVDGEYLTEVMSLAECEAIRDRTSIWKSYKAGKVKATPWSTDPEQMMRKTVIKRGSKFWPRTDRSSRFDQAIQVINDHEGIDFNKEQRDVTPPDPEQLEKLKELVKAFGEKQGYENPEERFLDKMSKDCGENLQSMDDLNKNEVSYGINLMSQFA